MATYVPSLGPRRMDNGVLSRTNHKSADAGPAAGGAFWSYASTATVANAKSTGWFSNAGAIGMSWGDIVFIVSYDATGELADLNIGVLTEISTAGAAELWVTGTIKST